jgi:hypothetical protein
MLTLLETEISRSRRLPGDRAEQHENAKLPAPRGTRFTARPAGRLERGIRFAYAVDPYRPLQPLLGVLELAGRERVVSDGQYESLGDGSGCLRRYVVGGGWASRWVMWRKWAVSRAASDVCSMADTGVLVSRSRRETKD